MTGKLANITKGRVEKSIRALVYGLDGVGKSAFASNAPDTIFLGAEDGTSELEVSRYPEEPKTWDDIFAAVNVLLTEEHDFKTFCLDTVDWAEPLCWRHVCQQHNWKSMNASPFNQAFAVAQDEWRRLLARLDELRDRRKMHILLLGHSVVKPFKNPEGEDFNRYILKLHHASAGILREWADCVMFATYETFTVDKTGGKLGVSSGARVLCTERRPAYDAKNRYNLPPRIALDWAEFEAAVRARRVDSPEALRSRIEQMLVALGDEEFAKTARSVTEKANDNSIELAKILNKVAAKVSRVQQEKEAA